MQKILDKINEGRHSIREASNMIYEKSLSFKPMNLYEQKEIEKLLVERNRIEKSLMSIVSIERRIRKNGIKYDERN